MKLYLIALLLIPLFGHAMEESGFGLIQKSNEKRVISIINDRLAKKSKLNQSIEGMHRTMPLHCAIFYDPTGALAQQLLEADADPNVQDSLGCTPLYQACHYLSLINIRLLLHFGADPNIACPYSTLTTPLHVLLARRQGKFVSTPNGTTYIEEPESLIQIPIKLLLAFGANPLIPNGDGLTVFKNYNLLQGRTNLVKRIFENKKQAYAQLLKGKNDQSESQFRRLPLDLVKKIIDTAYPDFPWPSQPISRKNMLTYLKSVPQ